MRLARRTLRPPAPRVAMASDGYAVEFSSFGPTFRLSLLEARITVRAEDRHTRSATLARSSAPGVSANCCAEGDFP